MANIKARIACPLCGVDVAEYKLKTHIGSRRCSMRIEQTSGGPDPMKQVPNWRVMADRVPKIGDIFFGEL